MIDIFLHPGEYYIGGSEYRIRTILGSCVSMTFWHPLKKIGAMSHFILPSRSNKPLKAPLDARYGNEAIQLLLNGLISLGVSPLQCQAKIFGGGNMFPSKKHLYMFDIGQRNGEIARSLLQHYNIPLISEHLFGEGHRQIIFNVSNGQVWARLVKPIELPDTKKE